MSGNSLRHIAIIMDGNNRWAKQRGKAGTQGHKVGAERIRDVVKACQEHQIEVLTLFAFSSENWQRPAVEVDALMGLFLAYLKKEVKKLREQRVKLKIIGRRDRFSKKIQQAIVDAEAMASEGTATLVIAADYGGQWDIAHAAQTLAVQVAEGQIRPEDITENSLTAGISTADLPPLDLLIRTGGEKRISNFLLWQAAYSELYFTDVYWPDFDGEALSLAVNDFHQRQRRYGKTSEQIERGE